MVDSYSLRVVRGKAASRTTTLFKLLPSVECVSPRHLNATHCEYYNLLFIVFFSFEQLIVYQWMRLSFVALPISVCTNT